MIKIRRKEGVPPVGCVSFVCLDDDCPQRGSHYEQWRPDLETAEFSVSAVIAQAALETGGFEVVEASQAQPKTPSKQKASAGSDDQAADSTD